MNNESVTTLGYRKPRLVFLVLMVLIIAGASALLSIGRQEDPTITNLFASIKTLFPGASPARVETLVTVEIENAIKEIADVDVIESTSATGISIISIELTDTIADEDIEFVWADVRDAVDNARANLPSGALAPVVTSDGISAYAAIAAISMPEGNIPITIAGRYAEELADKLRNVPGTKEVEIFGEPTEEVLVTVDQNRTAALGITLQSVSDAIRTADAKLQAGRLRHNRRDLVLEVTGEIDSVQRLQEIIVREGPDSSAARLADIATIERTYRKPLPAMAMYNGTAAILISATLEDGLQIDKWSGYIREEIAGFQKVTPAGLDLKLIFDQSTYTADRLLEVGKNMSIGVALVVAVLLLTLGFRAAMIVAIILPVVTLATLATLNFIGLAIHQMSVSGLIVALGLLVDAGIVVTDEVAKRIRAGVARINAVKQAVHRLAAPLFASTATTALAFTPMILLPGPPGDFVGSVAIAVVVMLFWSLFIALTITPALAGWIMPAGEKASWFNSGIPSGLIGRVFRKTLYLSVRNPVRCMALALVLPVIGFASMSTLTAQFFPGDDRDQFYIEFQLPPGTAIAETKALAERTDQLIAEENNVVQTYWSIGQSGPGFYYNIISGRSNAPAYAQAFITTTSPQATETLVTKLERTLADAAPQAQVLVRGLVQGPPVAAPVELRVVGSELDTLRQIGDDLVARLSAVDTITIARTTQTGGAPKVVVDVDEAKARALGLNMAAIANQLNNGLEGVTGGSLLERSEQLPVRVRFADDVRNNLDAIRDLPIVAPLSQSRTLSGEYSALPLSAIADITLLPSDSAINRRNGERVNTVQGFTLRSVLPEEALKAVQTQLEDDAFTLPAGYRLEIGGDSDARSSTLNNLLATVGIIVTLSIAIIVMTFNSFRLTAIALVVCVLSAGLSILALAVFRYPFGISAILGFIGSIGVSINAAIIIMTGLQANKNAVNGNPNAMVNVLMGSSRHIISTTVTTFGGFLPLILAGGGFWPPFAMAVAGGVLLSTVISFYFTPPAFALTYGPKKWGTSKRTADEYGAEILPINNKAIPMD